MIKRKRDMDTETRELMRGGVGHVTITHLFNPGELQSPTRLCARLVISPGSSIGMHAHDNEEEVFYVISGQCEINDSGDIQELGPGDAVVTGGASHCVKCTSHHPCELLAIVIKYVEPETQEPAK